MPKDARPPRKWFYRCVRTVRREVPEVKNPEALCAWVYWHHAKLPTIKEILADIPKAKRQLKLKGVLRVRRKRKKRKR